MISESLKGPVLVTGANGFVGRHAVSAFLNHGYRVRCLVRKIPSPPLPQGKSENQLEMVTGDLRDEHCLYEAVKGVQAVIHIAGLVAANKQSDYDEVNVTGTSALANAAINYNVKQFLLVSSLAAGQPRTHDKPHQEHEASAPISAYGKSKLRAEEALTKLEARGMIRTIVRPPSVYGPGDRQFFAFFKLMRSNIAPWMYGNPAWYSFIYVKDLAEGIVTALEKNTSDKEIYYLTDNTSYSWNDFVTRMAEAMKKRKLIKVPVVKPVLFLAALGYEVARLVRNKPLSFGLEKYDEFVAPGWVCSGNKAKAKLNFEAPTSLKDGIEKTHLWYQKNGWY